MAIEAERLLAIFEARMGSFEKAVRKAKADAEKSFGAIEKAGKKAEDTLANVGNRGTPGFNKLNQSLGQTRSNVQNLQFQINDIATQLSSGTSFLQVMSQQSGQVIQSLSGAGGVLGALRLIGSAVVNPFTLATVAITTLAGVTAAFFSDTSKDAEEANKKLEEHRNAIKAAIDAWQGAPPKELVQYNNELERLANLDKQRAGFQILIDEGLKPVNQAAAEAADTFYELFSRLEARNVDASVLSALKRDFDAMKDAIDGGNASVNDLLPLFTRLQDLEGQIGQTKGFQDLKKQIQDLIPLLGGVNEELRSTRRNLDNLGSNFRVDMGDDVGSYLRDPTRPTIPLPQIVNETPEQRPRAPNSYFDDLGSDAATDRLKREAERAADKLNDAIARQTSVAVDAATTLIGMSENSDAGTINAFLKRGGVDLNAATTAWCAAFVNSALAQVGVKGTGSNLATDFLNWGTSVNLADIQRGDVLVDPNGRSAGQMGGHVGFATGQLRVTAAGISQIEMLSGNASDKVQADWVNASDVVARRATDAFAVPANALQNLTQKSAEAKAATEAQTAALAAQKQAYENLNQIATTALNGIATALADGKIEGQEVLQIITQIITQLLSMPRVPGGGGLFGGGGGGLLGGLIIPGILHEGGVAGRDGYGHGRAVSASAFRGARRYHKGGGVGLRPGEVAAVLQQGEVVVPKGGFRGGTQQPTGIADVRVYMDDNGKWQAEVERISEGKARSVTRAGIIQHDKDINRSFGARMANAQARQL